MTTIVALSAPPAAGSADAEALLALERATQDRPLTLDGLLRETADDARGVVLVARAGRPIIGMASARLLGDEAHVIRLAVDAAHRRQGAGRALLEGLAAWATGASAPSLLLEVRAGNDAALALYASAAFVVDGRRPRYYPDGEDALLLRRTLDGDRPVAGTSATGAGRG